MSVPLLDARALEPSAVREALLGAGCFQLIHPLVSGERWQAVLRDARAFFDQPPATKAAVAIEHSRHYRGYSQMRNERDWREQIHFGAEMPAASESPPFLRLDGPNLWPPDAEWRRRMTAYLAGVASVGEEVLSAIALSLELPRDHFHALVRDPYLLMKLICYHPQPGTATKRPGVASHVDFSWVTITLQDETGGLQMRRPDGAWVDVPPAPGTLLVHLGELLQFATGGYYAATPHRVTNPSSERERLSIPVFVNPNLRTTVGVFDLPPMRQAAPARSDGEHVHRVFRLGGLTEPFVFGEAEWRRKGLNVWCSECVGSA